MPAAEQKEKSRWKGLLGGSKKTKSTAPDTDHLQPPPSAAVPPREQIDEASSGRSNETNPSLLTPEQPSDVSRSTSGLPDASTNPTTMSVPTDDAMRGQPSSYTSPTIKRETHSNPVTGQTVTTTSTTTTTTTTITNSDGVKTTIEKPNDNATELPTGMEPPTQVEQDERPSETPGKRLIPQREQAPISPISPTHEQSNSHIPNNNTNDTFSNAPAPIIPERNVRRSLEGRPLSTPVQQPQEPYAAAPAPPPKIPQQAPSPRRGSADYTTNSPFPPARESTLRETPGAGPQPPPATISGYQIPRKAPGAKTFENLKRAAAGVHGASDLIRGTINSSIDNRFHEPDSFAVKKNAETIERGRWEAENQRFQHSFIQPQSQAQTSSSSQEAMPQLDQIQETKEPSIGGGVEPDYHALGGNGAAAQGADIARPRSRFSGMFVKKERSPSLGPGDPPRKLKKARGVF